jgi:uncharacterized protein YkuJ
MNLSFLYYIIMISGISIETNSLISPRYASKSECYKCPECNKDILLCKGDTIRPYFRHKVDVQPCKYYNQINESQMHKDAKALLQYWLQNYYCATITRTCIHCHEKEIFEIPEIDEKSKIKLEHRFDYNGLKIADVCYLDEENVVCIFEIYHTHKTESINRPGMWFELNAEKIIEHNPKDKNVILTCARKEWCEECIEKENQKNKRRKNATNILYGWLKDEHIKPFNYFQVSRVYHNTEILKDDYFNIAIYEKWEDDNELCIRYKIRLFFQDETPDFQDHEKDDIGCGITGIYFIDVDWVCQQIVKPHFIRYEYSMDYFKNGYARECTANNGGCDKNSGCFYNLPFRVKTSDSGTNLISVDEWCDIENGSEEIPCVLCKEYSPMSMMITNRVSWFYCKNCDIECFTKERLYFEVRFSEKDKFKNLGGYWDSTKKLWYCQSDNDNLDDIKKVWFQK